MDGRSICIILTDPIKVFEQKGEIKSGYYNPQNYFEKVILISFTSQEARLEVIRTVVGSAEVSVFPVGEIKIFNFFNILIRIFNIVRKNKPSVLRAYDPSFRGIISVLIGKLLKIPVVISLHLEFDDQRKFDKRLLLRLRMILERISIRSADSVICVTDYVKRYALRYGAKRAVTIYNGVNIGQFNISRNKTMLGGNLVLSVGRLAPQKYQECLIRAVAFLDAELILIGDGCLFEDLHALTIKLGVENKVKFIRAVPNREIHRYFEMAKVFAIATHYEGFCIPIIEAMAAGLPIVASNLEVISEIMDGCGYLCENNPADFKRVIELLINNPGLRNELGQKARERAHIFDSAGLKKKEKEAYENICKLYA